MAMASRSSRGNRKVSMTRSSVLNNPLAGAPAVLHPTSAPGSDPSTQRNHCLRRRFRHRLGIKRPLATSDYRVSNSEIHDAHGSRADRKLADEGTCRQKGVSGVQMAAATVASSRRLAAALWHLRPSEAKSAEWNNQLKHSSALLFSAMEKVTKWDPGPAIVPKDIYRFHGHLKLPEDELVNDFSVISGLQMELERTRSYINDLESEQQSAKKKLNQFMKRLAEEKELWRRRENEKAIMVVEHIKDHLIRERKNRKRLEVVNAKLVDELAEATLSARRCLRDHDKERKARKIVEEACEGLAKEIGEDIAEVEAIKRESWRLHEEVDEERRMLQVAEVWREERVQMKLIDAKLMLDEKHMQLCQLQGEIESFLKAQSGSNIDLKAVKEVDMLQGATKSIKVQDIVEFYCQPPVSRDIISVFDDLKPREETSWRERERERYHRQYDPANHVSETDAVSRESDSFLLNYAIDSNGKIVGVRFVSGDTGLETMSQVQKQASCSSPERSEPPVNGKCGKKSGIS